MDLRVKRILHSFGRGAVAVLIAFGIEFLATDEVVEDPRFAALIPFIAALLRAAQAWFPPVTSPEPEEN
jgi:hypothetical protein